MMANVAIGLPLVLTWVGVRAQLGSLEAPHSDGPLPPGPARDTEGSSAV